MRSRWTLLFLFTAACGARVVVEEGTLPSTPIPEAAYCTTAAKAYCPHLVDCCHAVKFDAEVAACEKNFVTSCEADQRAKRSAGRTYDASAAATCLAGQLRRSKTCAVAALPFYAMDDDDWRTMTACSQVWHGATPLGGKCSDPSECAASGPGVQVGCAVAPDSPVGVCKTRERLGEREVCGGAPGDRLQYCGGGLVCAPDDAGVRHCVRRASAGGACSPFAWPTCVDGLTCDPISRTCVPPRPVGAACVTPMFTTTELDATCVAPAECDSVVHVCVLPKPTGAACGSPSSAIELRCQRSDYCEPTTRTCAPRKRDGEACTTGDECRGGRCSAGRCVPNGAVADADSCKLAQ